MPSWVDLTEHQAALNVQQTQEGRVLLLRPLSNVPIPNGIETLGFKSRNNTDYVRDDLRFSLQDIQRFCYGRDFLRPSAVKIRKNASSHADG